MKTFALFLIALRMAVAHPSHKSHLHRHHSSAAVVAAAAKTASPAKPTVSAVPGSAAQKSGTTSGNSILLPLYSYPEKGAWDPLFKAADSHPNTNFIIVINPDNGPTASPDEAFTAAVKKVNSYPNIQAIGYIATGYGDRSASEIVKDVNSYAGWSSKGAGLDGIFFDEVVSIFSSSAASTYKTINQAVKDASGLQGQKTIVHNPGAVPASGLVNSLTDITVVFESAYQTYKTAINEDLTKLTGDRSAHSIMVYGLSGSVDLSSYVSSLAKSAQYLFVTDLGSDFYAKFSPNWDEFVSAVSS